MLENFNFRKPSFRLDAQKLGQQIRRRFWRYPWLINGLKQIVFHYRKVKGLIARKKLIAAYFGTHPIRKVSIGTGYDRRDGWLNTDYYPVSNEIAFMDATSVFPIE